MRLFLQHSGLDIVAEQSVGSSCKYCNTSLADYFDFTYPCFDLALLRKLIKLTDYLASRAAKVGLRIRREKTKVMLVREQQPMALKINQQEAEILPTLEVVS